VVAVLGMRGGYPICYVETHLEDGGCVVDHRRSRWVSRYLAGDLAPVVPSAGDYLHPDNAVRVPLRFAGS
jgi:hypothetical protein